MDWPINHRRQAGEGSQSQKGAIAAPREASYTKLQADFVANQDFLGFLIVDILQEGHSQRSASQKREGMPVIHPENLSSWDGGGDKRSLQLGATTRTKDLVT